MPEYRGPSKELRYASFRGFTRFTRFRRFRRFKVQQVHAVQGSSSAIQRSTFSENPLNPENLLEPREPL
jgi:hypothetical protein